MIQYLATLIPALALAASPALAQGGFLGVELAPAAADGQAVAAGARIVRVEERSAASIMGLRVGDVVSSVDGVAVRPGGSALGSASPLMESNMRFDGPPAQRQPCGKAPRVSAQIT